MKFLFLYIRWGLLYLVSLLPLRLLYIFSDIAAFVLRYVLRYRVSVLYTNVSRSFPDLKYIEVKSVVGEYYTYMCDIMLESIWAISASEKQMCKVVRVKNREVIADVAQRHRSVLTVMGHSGNWELIGAIFGESAHRPDDNYANGKYVLAYKHAHTESTDDLMKKMRMHQFVKFKKGGGVIESKRIMRHILANRNDMVVYTLIADQNPTGKDKVIVNFLNQPTAMLGGPEYIASKLNLPVVFLHIYREKRGRYYVEFTNLTESAGELKPGELTGMFAKELEKAICANKYNWLWTHKRWKRDLEDEEMIAYKELVAREIELGLKEKRN